MFASIIHIVDSHRKHFIGSKGCSSIKSLVKSFEDRNDRLLREILHIFIYYIYCFFMLIQFVAVWYILIFLLANFALRTSSVSIS